MLGYAAGYAECYKSGGFCPGIDVMAAGLATYCCQAGKVAHVTRLRHALAQQPGASETCGTLSALTGLISITYPSLAPSLLLGVPPPELAMQKKYDVVFMAALVSSSSYSGRSKNNTKSNTKEVYGGGGSGDIFDAALHIMEETPGMKLVMQKLNGHSFVGFMGACGDCAQHGGYCPMINTLVESASKHCVDLTHTLTADDKRALRTVLMDTMRVMQSGGGWGDKVKCYTFIAGVVVAALVLAFGAGPIGILPAAALVAMVPELYTKFHPKKGTTASTTVKPITSPTNTNHTQQSNNIPVRYPVIGGY